MPKPIPEARGVPGIVRTPALGAFYMGAGMYNKRFERPKKHAKSAAGKTGKSIELAGRAEEGLQEMAQDRGMSSKIHKGASERRRAKKHRMTKEMRTKKYR